MSSVSESYNDIIERYKKECPRATPFVCACEKGHVEDVKAMIRGVSNVTAMVNEKGKNSLGNTSTPLIAAASKELSDIVKILLDNNADTATTDEGGENALYTAWDNQTTTTIVRLLLNKMELKDINHKDTSGRVPLDLYYDFNTSPIKQQLIDLIRQKGGQRADELDTDTSDNDTSNSGSGLKKRKRRKLYLTLSNLKF